MVGRELKMISICIKNKKIYKSELNEPFSHNGNMDENRPHCQGTGQHSGGGQRDEEETGSGDGTEPQPSQLPVGEQVDQIHAEGGPGQGVERWRRLPLFQCGEGPAADSGGQQCRAGTGPFQQRLVQSALSQREDGSSAVDN